MDNKATALHEKAKKALDKMGLIDAPHHFHDLKTILDDFVNYQIELEEQNRHLQETQVAYARLRNFDDELFDHTPSATVVVDKRHVITRLNRAARNLLGLSIDDAIDTLFFKYVEPSFVDCYANCMAALGGHVTTCHCEIGLVGHGGDSALFVGIDAVAPQVLGAPEEEYLLVLTDLSRQKEIEEELAKESQRLKDSEKLLNEMGKMAKVGGWELDCNSMRQVWTDETYAIHDREKGVYNPNSTEELSRFEPGSKELIAQAFEAAFGKGEPYDLELEMTTVKGTRKWVRAVCRPELSNGHVIRLSGTLQDITELKHAQNQLRDSELKYRTLFSSMEQGFCIIEKVTTEANEAVDFRYVEANPAFAVHTGLADVVGKTIRQVVPSAEEAIFDIYDEVVSTGKHHKFEAYISSLEFWIEAEVISTSIPTQVAVLFSNVTERKRVEKDIRESEMRFSTLFKQSPSPVGITRATDFRIVDVNDAWCRMTGYLREEVLGATTTELGLTNADSFSQIHRLLQKNNRFAHHEIPLYTRNKEERQVVMSSEMIDLGSESYFISTFLDLSELVQAEREASEVRNLFRTLFDLSPVAYSLGSLSDRKMLDVNGSWEALFGYEKHEVLGRLATDFDFWQDDVVRDTAYQLLQQKGRLRNYEVDILTKYGEKRRTSMYSEIIEIEKTQYIFSVFIDVTERKRIEEKLQESQQDYKKLFEHNPLPMWVYDIETLRFLDVNGSAVLKYGFSREEFLGMTILDIRPPEDYQRLLDNIHAVDEGLDEAGTWRHLLKDGTVIDVEITSHTLSYGGRKAELVLANDVTEKVLALAKLVDSETKFYSIFKNNPVGTVLTRLEDGLIQDVNDSLLTLFGYQREEMIGLCAKELDVFVDFDRESLLRALKDKGGLFNEEVGFRKKNGDVGILLLSGVLIHLKGETNLLSMMVDITKRNEDDETLRVALAKYKTLFENFPMGITVSDAVGNILETNATAETLLGITGDELSQRQLSGSEWKVVRTDGTPMPVDEYASVRALLEGRKVENVEMGIVKPDNGIVWINVTASPIPLEDYGVVVTYNDIGDRKQAEKKLRDNQVLLNQVLDSEPDAIFALDLQYRLLINNKRHQQVLVEAGGHPFNVGDIVLPSSYDPHILDFWQRLYDRAFKGEEFTEELTWPYSDGLMHTTENHFSPLRNNLGTIVGALVVIHDITARKNAMEQLRASEAKFKAVFENSPVGISLIDNDRNLLESNNMLEGIVQMDESSLSTGVYRARKYIREDGSEKPENEFASARAIDKRCAVRNEITGIVFEGGDTIWTQVSVAPLGFDDTRYVVITQDITERKRAVDALREHEKRLRKTIETTSDGFWIVDSSRRFVEVNEAYCAMSGYSREELMDMTITDVEALENMDVTLERIGKIVSKGSDRFETIHRRKDGSMFDVEMGVNLLDQEEGLMICFCRDISRRKQAEKQLRDSNEKLSLFVEHAPVSIAMFDRDMRILAVSKRWLADYNFEGKEIVGQLHYDLFPEMTDEWKKMHQRGMAGEILSRDNDRLERHDGAVQYSRWELRPWYTADKEVGGIILFTEDVTDKKEAQDKLIESDGNFRNLFYHSPVAYLVLKDGVFVDCNNASETLVGGNRSSIIGKTPADLSPVFQPNGRNSVDYVKELIHKAIEDKHILFEWTHIREDGSSFIAQVELSLMEQFGESIILVCWQDITERKQTLEKLRESEKRFATIFEDSPVAIAISRLIDGKIMLVNSSAIDLFGYASEELIGHTTIELGLWGSAKDRERLFGLVAKGHHVAGMEATLCPKSGKKTLVQVWGELIELAGEPCLMVEIIDISERKKAEQRLREREMELVNAQELAKMGSWRIDLSSNKFSLSKNYRVLLGYADDTAEILFDQFVGRVHPDDIHLLDLSAYRFTPQSAPVVADFRISMPEGTIKWFQNTMVGEFKGGKLVALKGTCIDITDKKKHEEEIRSQNEKLNAILNSLPDKLFVHDSNGNFLEAYTTDPGGFIVPMYKFIGKNLSDIFPKDVADLNLRFLSECLKKKVLVTHEFSTEFRGGWHTYEVRVFPFMKDKAIRFVRDITEQKVIENQIEKLYKAIEQSPVAIVITDAEANVTYASHAFEEITGYTKDEIIGKNTRILKSEQNDHSIYSEMWEAILSGEMWEGDLINKKKNGDFYWEHLSITPLSADNGRIAGYLAVKQDISEKKKIEQEILELNTNLERKVEERTQELKRANAELVKAKEEAETANKAKSVFLANMSHEIRTPLNSIIGFSELLYQSESEDRKRSQVESIRNSGRSLLDIINDILDLSKVEAGKIILEPEPLNVFKIVAEVSNVFEQKAEEKKLALTVESETDLTTPLLLDETRLRQILFNVIGNAIKFTHVGGVSVLIHHEEKDDDKVDLRITVSDTGIGIPEDQVNAIFEPFVQQHGQVQKNYGGTGLGLAISRRMAEAMGGEISVKSEPNKGSEFCLVLRDVVKSTIPIVENESKQAYYSTIRFDGSTILIVDDISDNRKLLRDVLDHTGALLLEAETGSQAVEIATSEKPDIILMDIRMPLMDGLEACRILKNNPRTALIPCVAVTASIKLGQTEREMPENFDDTLMKPVVFDQLFEILLRYLDHAAKTQLTYSFDTGCAQEEGPEWSEDLKKHVLQKLVPVYNHVMETHLVDEMEDFGTQLIDAGHHFGEDTLMTIGHQLCEYADRFEVDKLTELMRQFQLLLTRKL